jgi:hypothetical protein
MRILTVVAAALVLFLLTGCDLLSPLVSPTPQGLIVTLDNDGQTIRLHIGDSFLLKLGEGYDWTVTIDDQTVVSRVMNVMVVRGAQGLYQAKRTGQTMLMATGDPPCRQSQPPCAMPSRLFRLQIVVQ